MTIKVGILAGGLGSRLAEETEIRPKPMVEIGGIPILLHIMRHYADHGFEEFAIALGYKGDYIKRYMAELCHLQGNLTIDLAKGQVESDAHEVHDWRVQLIETGLKTMTGGRIKRLAPYLGDETFMLTWGDGVSDIDLRKLLEFHKAHGKLATVTAVRPPARYGHLDIRNGRVAAFTEKPQIGEGWINGAFFVLEPEVFDYIAGDDMMWEGEPLEKLARDGQLMAYQHARVLAVHGHAAGEAHPRRDLGQRRCALEKEDDMKVLVTGHDGYIGCVLTPMLRAAGHEVVGLDNFMFHDCRFTALPEPEPVTETVLDVRDVEAGHLAGFDAVIHLAGLSNDPLGDLHPDITFAINHRASVRLARAREGRGRGAVRVLVVVQQLRGGERRAADRGIGVQPGDALRRVQGQGRAGLAHDGGRDFSPVYLRNATVYGVSPRLRGDLVVNNLTGYAFTIGRVLLKSAGTSWRPLLHVATAPRHSSRRSKRPGRASTTRRSTSARPPRTTASARSRRSWHRSSGSEVAFADGAEPDMRNYNVRCDKIRDTLRLRDRLDREEGCRRAVRPLPCLAAEARGSRRAALPAHPTRDGGAAGR